MHPSVDPELVTVFDTQQESEAMVVQGLLTSVGIEAVVTALEAPQDVLPIGGIVVRVTAKQADAAREVIAEYNNTSVELEEGDEEEPAQ